MSAISSYSIFNTATAVGNETSYTDIITIQTFANLATNNICAFYDTTGTSQSLYLGATSNVNIESATSANIYTTTGVNFFDTNVVNNQRYDSNFMRIYTTDVETISTTNFKTSNNMYFSCSNSIQFNSTILNTQINNTDHFYTSSTCGFMFDNVVTFSSNVTFAQNIVTQGSIFGCNLNVWSAYPAVANTDINQVGFGFRVNENNELELIKTSTFGPTGSVSLPISKKIAVFGGNHNISSNDTSDTSYLVFNNLNGVSVSSNGQILQTSTSSSTINALANLFTVANNGYVGLGTVSPQYKFDVNGGGHFSMCLQTDQGIITDGNIVANNNTINIGEPSILFNKIYGSKLYYSSTNFITNGTGGNQVTFTNDAGNYSTVVCSNVVFGPSSAPISLQVGSSGQIQFVDVNQNILNAAGTTSSDPTQSSDILATIKAVNIVYNSNVALSNAFYSGTYNFPITMNNVVGITGSNATFSNVLVNGADFAEYMFRSKIEDVYESGEVVGIDINGKITKIFADSFHFMVISNNPGLVGGASEDKTQQETIGYCGRVQVNCSGALVGQHIVPCINTEDNISISAISIHDSDITFDQYKKSIGKVISVDNNGIPIIVLKSN